MKTLRYATAVLCVCVPSYAQIATDSPFNEVAFPEGGEVEVRSSLPRIGLKLVDELPLPGPLPGKSPLMIDGVIRLPLLDGVALIDLAADSPVRVVPVSDAPAAVEREGERWVLSPSGRRRFRTVPGGTLYAQRKCRYCRKGWRKIWKLRLPGGTPSEPLVLEDRVIVAALDNRIYAVRAKNGHRLWSYDVGQRFSKPPAGWSGEFLTAKPPKKKRGKAIAQTVEAALALVVPDSGDSLVVLDSVAGRRVAEYGATEAGDRLIGSPIVTEHGEIAVARQRYAESDAGLVVFVLQSLLPDS